ncbi:MAG: acyltransferase family protein, partial [Cellvibrio sp.]
MTRLVELDWLRVLVFGLLILYHVGMLYSEGWGWHYKSSYSSQFLTNIMLWSNQWRMCLLFFISGAAVTFLLASQPRWIFLRKRVPLLLLPLIFGMLVVVVPQVYVEANSTGVIICPDYLHFWYIYLDQTSVEFAPHKTIGQMQLDWNHLWFLPYLLAYTLIIWTIYPLLKSPKVTPVWRALRNNISMPLVVFLPIFIFYGIAWALYAKHPTTHNFVQDWFNHARSFLSFLLGFVLVQLPALWKRLASLRWFLLAAALCSYAYIVFAFHGGSLGTSVIGKEVSSLIWSANTWLWMLCLIAWAQHIFTSTNPVLRYLNSGVYCFYILHQTLIIVFAYFLVTHKLGPILEPALFFALVAITCVLIYEFIRRLPLVTILFGVQIKKGDYKSRPSVS